MDLKKKKTVEICIQKMTYRMLQLDQFCHQEKGC